jgi:hypothetical protein
MRARSASGAISPIPRTPEAATSRPVVVAVRCGTAHPMAYLKKDAPADVGETLRPNRSRVPEARNEPSIDDREDRAFGFDRGVRRSIEDASHVAIALRAAVAIVHARALLVAGAGAHPRRDVLGRRKRRRGDPDFGNDLLRGIDAQPATRAARHRRRLPRHRHAQATTRVWGNVGNGASCARYL